MAAKKDLYEAWWLPDGDDVGPSLVATVERIQSDYGQARMTRALEQTACYYGCPIDQVNGAMLHGIQPGDKDVDGRFGGSPVNVSRRIVDTATARIYATQRPKVQVTTSGADYMTRIAAREQSKFLRAHSYQQQDGWSDGWQLAQQIGRDSLIYGTGIQKVYPDFTRKRIVRERKRLWNLYVDPHDAENRDPRSIFEIHRYDRHRLMAMFPDSKDAIKAAQSFELPFGRGRYAHGSNNRVAVFEGYRLPDSEDEPGRHVIAVSAGRGKSVLLDEPWEVDRFPYSFIRYREPIEGFWGTSLIDELITIQQQLDLTHLDLSNNVDALARGYMCVQRGSIENEDSLTDNKGLKVIFYEKNHEKPDIEMPAPFNPAVFQWYQHLLGMPNELSGVSELTAQGRREPGVESGVAIRTVNDLQSTLFLPQSRDFERFFADTARIEIDCANRLVDSGADIEATLESEGFLGALDWKTIRFPGDQYKVQIQVSNSLEDSVAGRKERLVELARSTVLNPLQSERALDSQTLDVEQAMAGVTSQINYYEKVIATYQHWDPEKEAEKEIRVSPDPLLDLSLARAQFTMAYAEMLELDAGGDRLALFRDFIEACDELMAPPEQAAPPGAGAGGMPADMPPGLPPDMGAPPMPPGPSGPPLPPGPPMGPPPPLPPN